MSGRTAHWVSRTTPGVPPPPPSRAVSAHPPPTIYPESSVSNPNASRYTGRSSRATSQSYSSSHSRSYSAGPPPAGSRYSTSSHSHARSNSHSGSHRSSYRGGSPLATPVDTYYAPPQEPIIARTSGADGRTDNYMIIPGKGQRVEILHPTPTASTHYAHYSTSSAKEKPLLKKLLGKVEWGDKRSSAPSYASTRMSRSRRNSTGSSYHSNYHSSHHSGHSGGSGSWTVIPGSRADTQVITTRGRVVSTSGGGSRVVYV